MSGPFHLRWSWTPREEGDTPQLLVDASRLAGAFERFSATHRGDVELTAGDASLHLELDRDIGLVVEELPDALLALAADGISELYFAEQGTDLRLEMRRDDGMVRLRASPGAYSRPELAGLEVLGPVPAAAFFSEWRRFLTALLGALESCDEGLDGDADYAAWRRKVDALGDVADGA